MKPWIPHGLAVAFYAAAAAVMGREVLRTAGTAVMQDAGDPLLTAAILHWNATNVPLTDAWWQLPIFFPTRDALAFSEHLLGLSVLAAPLQWITGDPLMTYNLTALLTFPLSAVSMYVLVYTLTRSAAGAFVAGLAFGFAPYRLSQLSHIQMLASFWAPLALAGLHKYVESGQRRWAVCAGAAWMLQAASNNYALVYFSTLVGLWILWFVVRVRRWRQLGWIAAAFGAALVPLLPIVQRYLAVHARHGFVRDLDEVRYFSADVLAVLCAPSESTVWGWLQVACRPEGQLFPGAAVIAFAAAAVFSIVVPRQGAPSRPRVVTWMARLLLLFGLVNVMLAIAVALEGPVRFSIGPIRISSSSTAKSVLLSVPGLLLALALFVGAAVRRAPAMAFYLLAAVAMWALSLGPTVTYLGERRGISGPYAWLMMLPGGAGLRVPARFWMFAALCLAAVAGLLVARLVRGRRPGTTLAVAILAGVAVLADGWGNLRTAPVPDGPPRPDVLRARTVLTLPFHLEGDMAAEYHAVTGGWRSVNGYSGYEPSYYAALKQAAADERDVLFDVLRSFGDVDVVVSRDDPRLEAFVARQPGVVSTAGTDRAAQYRLLAQGVPPRPPRLKGRRLPVEAIEVSCRPDAVSRMFDSDPSTRWDCGGPQEGSEHVLIDLGALYTVGAVVNGLGPFSTNFPRHLVVETSLDREVWHGAWDGDVLRPAVAAAFADPANMTIVVPFDSRPARYVRLRQTGSDPAYYWSITELEIWERATP